MSSERIYCLFLFVMLINSGADGYIHLLQGSSVASPFVDPEDTLTSIVFVSYTVGQRLYFISLKYIAKNSNGSNASTEWTVFPSK